MGVLEEFGRLEHPVSRSPALAMVQIRFSVEVWSFSQNINRARY